MKGFFQGEKGEKGLKGLDLDLIMGLAYHQFVAVNG